jgi:nucleoside-diphosphate-sugar epimerase
VVALFIDRMCAGERPIIYDDGNQTRDFIYIDDVVQANLLAADTPTPLRGEVLNVGCGLRISINQLVQEINGILGTDITPDHQDSRAGEVRHSQADISKIKGLLGFEPKVSLRTGLEKLIAATQ